MTCTQTLTNKLNEALLPFAQVASTEKNSLFATTRHYLDQYALVKLIDALNEANWTMQITPSGAAGKMTIYFMPKRSKD